MALLLFTTVALAAGQFFNQPNSQRQYSNSCAAYKNPCTCVTPGCGWRAQNKDCYPGQTTTCQECPTQSKCGSSSGGQSGSAFGVPFRGATTLTGKSLPYNVRTTGNTNQWTMQTTEVRPYESVPTIVPISNTQTTKSDNAKTEFMWNPATQTFIAKQVQVNRGGTYGASTSSSTAVQWQPPQQQAQAGAQPAQGQKAVTLFTQQQQQKQPAAQPAVGSGGGTIGGFNVAPLVAGRGESKESEKLDPAALAEIYLQAYKDALAMLDQEPSSIPYGVPAGTSTGAQGKGGDWWTEYQNQQTATEQLMAEQEKLRAEKEAQEEKERQALLALKAEEDRKQQEEIANYKAERQRLLEQQRLEQEQQREAQRLEAQRLEAEEAARQEAARQEAARQEAARRAQQQQNMKIPISDPNGMMGPKATPVQKPAEQNDDCYGMCSISFGTMCDSNTNKCIKAEDGLLETVIGSRFTGLCVSTAPSINNVIQIDQAQGDSWDRQAVCFSKCKAMDAWGCELTRDAGCFMHSEPVARGDGSDKAYCWNLNQKTLSKGQKQQQPSTPTRTNGNDQSSGGGNPSSIWMHVQDPSSGMWYYFNEYTGQSSWDAPSDPNAVIEVLDQDVAEEVQVTEEVDEEDEDGLLIWPWRKVYDEASSLYFYYNEATQVSQWEVPPVFREEVKEQSDDWEKVFDDSSGLYYYYNYATGESQWDPPSGFEEEETGTENRTPITQTTDVDMSEWEEVWDDVYETYYYFNINTGESTWIKPY